MDLSFIVIANQCFWMLPIMQMENKILSFIKDELSGWKRWEILWLSIACLTIVVLSLYMGDTTIGILSATTGVICVVCVGKGKLSAYLFGAINAALYAYIAYSAKYYGEVMLNALYYFPMQFYGYYVWSKNMNKETKEVNKRNMTRKQFGMILIAIAIATFLYGFILKRLGGSLPFFDSFSTVASVIAMILAVKMFAEQWLLWIVVDIVTIMMWGFAYFTQETESVATLLMWCVYLLNAIFMYVKWQKEANE